MSERISRSNTVEEKRRMRNERKRRKRSRKKVLETQLALECTLRSEAEKKTILYRNMSKSFWDRWRWALEQRRECMKRERQLLCRQTESRKSVVLKVHDIEPSSLSDIVGKYGCQKELYVGRGSFGVVRLQMYRNIEVAVKEFLPHTVASDVHSEANILARFSHPYLPHLFGIVTSELPYRIVMQYHGLSGLSTSVTLHDALTDSGKGDYKERASFLLSAC